MTDKLTDKKAVITADVHLHTWDEFATILPNGMNSRLQVGIDAMNQVIDAARGNMLVIAGDLFHTREELSIPVLHAASAIIERAATECSEVILLVGNHDQYLKDGSVHSLSGFKRPGVAVIDSPTVVRRSGLPPLLFMPYYADYGRFSTDFAKLVHESGLSAADNPVAILHADIIGFEMNGGFLSKKGVGPGYLATGGVGGEVLFKQVISGHYHKPQTFRDYDVHYVGSPYQHDRSEAGHEKRFMVLRKDGSVESVPMVGLPKFRSVTLKEAKEEKESGTKDFIDVICSEDDVRTGWSNDLPQTFNVVLKSSQGPSQSFTTMKVGQAVQHALKELGRQDLIELAMERVSRD